jgi:hypothetical protein
MSNHQNAEVLVREGIRQATATAVVPATYPMTTDSKDQTVDLLPRISEMRTELKAGNPSAAIRIGHFVGGRAARLGDRRTASLVRHAVTMSRFWVLDQAGDLLAQAEQELTAAR